MPRERKPRERTVNEKVLQQMRRLLGKCPWISASESALWFPAARVYGEGDREKIDPATAHDALKLLCEQGEVSRRLAGRRHRAVYRHILNQAGIRVLYPDPFSRGIGVPRNHRHNMLWRYRENHEHVPWWLGRAGAEALLRCRLEELEVYYNLLPALFDVGQPGWGWCTERIPDQLRNIELFPRFLDTLFGARVDYRTAFSFLTWWVGKSLSVNALARKWRTAYRRLETATLMETIEHQRYRRAGLEPPLPAAFARPLLSGHILFCKDTMAYVTARAFVNRLPEEQVDRFLILDLEQRHPDPGLAAPGEWPNLEPLEDLRINQYSTLGIAGITDDRVVGKFVLDRVGRPSELAPNEPPSKEEKDKNNER